MTVARMVETRSDDASVVRVEARFPARAEGLSELHAALDRFFSQAAGAGAPVRSMDQLAIRTAAAEIGANIVEHACLHLSDPSTSLVLARHLHRVEVTFEDPGAPYVVPERHELDSVALGGRGLMLVEASVDTVRYSRTRGVNRWSLVRSDR